MILLLALMTFLHILFGGYLSKKFKLDLIVCLYYRDNLIVRLAWNVPSDGEGLQRQNFLLYPFQWLESRCGGPFYALCVNKWKGNEIQPRMLVVVACMMRILSIDFDHLLYISWLIVQHQDWVFHSSCENATTNSRTQILYNGYCQFWARFVESHKILVLQKQQFIVVHITIIFAGQKDSTI